jgi:creatinine amidohydrolase
VARAVRESDIPGGMAHACELETSLYLYIAGDRVVKEKIQKEMALPRSRFIWHDLTDPSPVQMMEWWSSFSHTGVLGDPTRATPGKGERLFTALMERMISLVREVSARKIRDRVDLHAGAPVVPKQTSG